MMWKLLRKRRLKRARRALRSIYFSFFSLMIAVVLCVLAVTTAFSVNRSLTHTNELLSAKLNQMKLSIESASFAHLRYRHYIELEVFLRGVMVDNDATGIFLQDPVNDLTISLGETVETTESYLQQVQETLDEYTDFKSPGVAASYFPLFVDNQLRGAVGILVGRPPLWQHIQKALIDYLGIALLVALIMAPVCAKATKRLVRPIKSMTGMSKQIGRGKFAYDEFTEATVEARTLAGSLARASNRIANQKRRIDSQIKVISQHAYSDEITGLANRNKFRIFMEEAVAKAEPFAIILIDLDHFKEINDTEGHDAGDYVLHISAKRMEDCVREVGLGGQALVSRLGGDEFAMVIKGLAIGSGQRRLLDGLASTLRQPISLGSKNVHVSGSIGLAHFPDDGKDYTTLLKAADLAMYEAKRAGKDTYRLFTPSLMIEIERNEQFALEIDRAIENAEIVPFYQPKLDLKTGKIVGVEALARWQHPKRGILEPEDFISFAKQTGRIGKIDSYMLTEVAKDLARWQQDFETVSVSINLSERMLTEKNLAGLILSLKETHKLSADMIELELSEAATMSDQDMVMNAFQRLKETGVKIAVDDYGTGYSNLAKLSQLSFDTLKIDRSLVVAMTESSRALAVMQSIVSMSKDLGYTTLAEGVETQEELDLLKQIGCNLAQGYVIARAMPMGKLMKWLEKNVGDKKGSDAAEISAA